jgi:hypothetical protein
MGLADLSSILWREREMLELLLFKLEEEQLVLATGRSRWLARATREVEMVLERLRQTEVLRAAEVTAVGVELGIGPDPKLVHLATAAGEPWTSIFREHHATFLTLTAEITSLAEANRHLLTAGQRAVRETLLSESDSVQTYGRDGTSVTAAIQARLLDEAV